MQLPGGWGGVISRRMEGCNLPEDGGVQAPGGQRVITMSYAVKSCMSSNNLSSDQT